MAAQGLSRDGVRIPGAGAGTVCGHSDEDIGDQDLARTVAGSGLVQSGRFSQAS